MVSLEEIATRAGVGIATLYRRFGTREELIKAAAEHVFVHEIATAIVIDGTDPWIDLVETLTGTVDAFAAHPVLVSLAIEHAVVGMDTLSSYATARERLLERAREAGVVRPELTTADLKAIVVMALAVVHHQQNEGPATRRYLSLLFDGMRPAEQPLPKV